LPAPLLPELIVIQLALLVAIQLHPDAAVTSTVAVPPAALNELPAGEIENTHELLAPSSVTVNVCPPIVIVPTREAEDVFSLTE